MTEAWPQMDWRQVRMNGGPPCFGVGVDGRGDSTFCGRAEEWQGHHEIDDHPYVSLTEYLNAATADLTARLALVTAQRDKAMEAVEHYSDQGRWSCKRCGPDGTTPSCVTRLMVVDACTDGQVYAQKIKAEIEAMEETK